MLEKFILKNRIKLGLSLGIIVMVLIGVNVSTAYADNQWQPLAEKIKKSINDPRAYQAIRLDNGMTVLLVSDKDAPKSLAGLAIPIGSLEDPNTQLGLAHYLEHMLLMGSKRYPQPDNLAEFLKKHGGSHNASTASYRTAFYLEVENDALDLAVDRLADAIAEPMLDPVNADRERHAVNAELTMARSRDVMRMRQVGAETLNPAHPAARFSGGNLQTLKDKPGSNLHKTLVEFYQHYYSANLMVGVIYGNQPIDNLAGLAARTFGRINNHNASIPEIRVPIVTDKQKGIFIHYVPVQPNKILQIDYQIDNNSAAFRSKTDTYIAYLIGNRSKNTLSDWLQKHGLIESISADADPMAQRNSGVFSITAVLTDKGLAHRDQVIAAIYRYIDLLRQQGMSESYFKEIANVLDLDFRYPSITRDMSYVEDLVDAMLRVPVEHVLDSSYIADRFDAKAIAARLDSMTPESARIWLISPNEPHNKIAYFVNAPYQVERISAQRIERWKTLAQGISLDLPTANPYIPTDFSLINAEKPTLEHPVAVINKAGLRAFAMPSRYFADEPKANIVLALRNPKAGENAQSQVMFTLMDYLAGRYLDQLAYQANVGGINFSTNYNSGLLVSASGFTQHLPQLLTTLIDGYRSFKPTEDQLEQAKSWYRQQLDAADKAKAYEQAIMPVQSLSRVPYTERSQRLDALNTITLPGLVAYRDHFFKQAALEIMALGNMSKQQVVSLANSLHQQLQTQGTTWWHGKYVVVEKAQTANLSEKGSSTDSALGAVYIPAGYDEVQSMAYSQLLSQVIQPWFYDQLRTQEQLGYAVFAYPAVVGRQSGIGFLLQSNSRDPAYLYQRYQVFYAQADKRLAALEQSDFDQYRNALIAQLRQRPQTLDEEAALYLNDFGRSNFNFDTRSRVINQLATLNKDQLLTFYRQAVITPNGMAMLSQVLGNGKKGAKYAQPKGWTHYKNASSLQKTLPEQVAP